jgi:1-deoxy-D-xylulose-5-phosphate reductoisomerase
LTASGGPFRSFHGDFSQITPEQALKHPTWNMGPKISVDSATLMNKGLEVIEAFQLFDVAPEQIDVVVHPQSVIHSLVEWQDGSLISQLGCADMRHPIQYAMSYPHRLTAPFASFDLTAMGSLTFEPPRRESFPCLDLAYEALKRPETGPVILNAANEQAVDAFLRGALAFSDIPRMIEKALERFDHASVYNLEDVLCLDREVRQVFGRN